VLPALSQRRSYLLKESHLTIENEGFIVKNERFAFDEVDSIFFHQTVTQKTMNFFNAGLDHNVELLINIKGRRKPLEFRSGPKYFTWLGGNLGEKASEKLISKYDHIRKHTLKTRISKYINSLEVNQYFIYDEKKFYANGNIESEEWSVNIKEAKPWLRRPFIIYHEVSKAGFFKSGKAYIIKTFVDSDVFYFLLEKLYGIRFKG
jgi:hypothetical protein